MAPRNKGLRSCVPVSITGNRSPEQASHQGPVGLNQRHEAALLTYLQDHYGWHLAQDGNLYAPDPSDYSWGADVA